jgi:hypothetical protein
VVTRWFRARARARAGAGAGGRGEGSHSDSAEWVRRRPSWPWPDKPAHRPKVIVEPVFAADQQALGFRRFSSTRGSESWKTPVSQCGSGRRLCRCAVRSGEPAPRHRSLRSTECAKAIVEPVFGQIKSVRGLRRFLPEGWPPCAMSLERLVVLCAERPSGGKKTRANIRIAFTHNLLTLHRHRAAQALSR